MTMEAEMEGHGHKPRDAWASRSWETGRILPQPFRHLESQTAGLQSCERLHAAPGHLHRPIRGLG